MEKDPKKLEENKKRLYELMDKLLEKIKGENRFLLTFHVIEDGKIQHSFHTNDFPNGDLLACVGYLEREFLAIEKRGASGNGRI